MRVFASAYGAGGGVERSIGLLSQERIQARE